MLVMKDRSTHDRQLLHASPLVAAFARAMIENIIPDVSMYFLHNEQCISTSIHQRQVSGFPMEVSVAFAAGPPPTPANIKISYYRPKRRGRGHYLTPPPT
jgi:hypothetical protein